jgi:NAD(P)-dependent dehydrogenase (short-subunit alcohol dehydrogenase family)
VTQQHPALAPGRVAVVTGAASGIGLAAAERFAALGMRVCLADVDAGALDAAAASLARTTGRPADVLAVPTDVGRRGEVERLRDRAYAAFGEVGLLMNNAGREGGGGLFGDPGRWREILETNLWGVVNGVQAFAPAMVDQGTPRAIAGSRKSTTCSGVQAPGGLSARPRARVKPVKVKPGISRCAVTRQPSMLRSSCASASATTLTPALLTL